MHAYKRLAGVCSDLGLNSHTATLHISKRQYTEYYNAKVVWYNFWSCFLFSSCQARLRFRVFLPKCTYMYMHVHVYIYVHVCMCFDASVMCNSIYFGQSCVQLCSKNCSGLRPFPDVNTEILRNCSRLELCWSVLRLTLQWSLNTTVWMSWQRVGINRWINRLRLTGVILSIHSHTLSCH